MLVYQSVVDTNRYMSHSKNPLIHNFPASDTWLQKAKQRDFRVLDIPRRHPPVV